MRRKLGLVFRVTLALAALVLVGLQTAVARGVISPSAWLHVIIVVAVAGIVFIDNSRSAYASYRRPESQKRYREIEKLARTAILSIDQLSKDVSVRSLGVSVFVCKTKWRRRWLKAIPFPQRELVRIVRFRMEERPQPSSVQWIKGKGAIGECWEIGNKVHRDHRATIANLGTQLTEQTFGELKPEVVSGFTYSEFREIRQKYVEVLAVPIKDEHGTRILGVLSVDRPADEGCRSNPSAVTLVLGSDNAEECAAYSANLIAQRLI